MARKCGKCGEEGHNARTCGKTEDAENAVINAGSGQIAIQAGVTKLPNGRAKLVQKVNPSRVERFNEVLKDMKAAAKNQGVYFKVKTLGIKESPVPKGYIPLAERGMIPGARKTASGTWVWDYAYYEIVHDDPWPEPDFEYIGDLEVGFVDPNAQAGSTTFGGRTKLIPTASANWEAFFKPRNIVNPLRYDPLDPAMETALTPQIEKLAQRGINQSIKNNKPNLSCDKCNPKGDNVERETTNLYLVLQDVPNFTYGREGTLAKNLKNQVFPLKEGQVIEIGGGCKTKFQFVSVEDIAILYGEFRAKRQVGSVQSPGSKAGWGWNEMDLTSHITRQCQLYAKWEELYLADARRALFQIKPEDIYSFGTYTYLNPDNPYRTKAQEKGSGIIKKNGGQYLLKARQFDYTDSNGITKTYFQPYDNMGGIKDMLEGLEDGSVPFDLIDVPVMNDETGLPVLDENGNVEMTSVKVPSAEWILEQTKITKGRKPRRSGYGSTYGVIKSAFADKIFEAKSADDVQGMVSEVIDYVSNLDLKNLPEILQDNFDGAQLLNTKKLFNLDAVGNKSVGSEPKDMAGRIWRIWAMGTFDKRAEESKQKAFDGLESKFVNEGVIGGQWLPREDWMTYGILSSFNLNRRIFEGMIYLTPNEQVSLEQTRQNQLKEEKARQERRRVQNLIANLPRKRETYTDYYGRTKYRGYQNWTGIGQPGTISDDEIFDLFGWGVLKQETPESYESLIRRNPQGQIASLYLYQPEADALQDFITQKLLSQAGIASTPTATQQTTAPATASSTLTKDEVLTLYRKANRSSTSQGTKGQVIPQINGYVAKLSALEGFVSRFGSRQGQKVRYVDVVTEDGQVFNFVYGINENIPSVGTPVVINNATFVNYKSSKYGKKNAIEVPLNGMSQR